jgi:pyridine nucleotide-disulfide oxidoreductase
MTTVFDHENIVVGAGPYGLACAAFLRHQGRDVAVFGDVMGAWKQMPRGMLLRSFRQASNIGGPLGGLGLADFERELGVPLADPLPVKDFVAYGTWYGHRTAGTLDPRLVRMVRGVQDGFVVSLDDGDELRTRRVVVAAGIRPFAWIPERFRAYLGGGVSHSSEHVDFSGFRGRHVLVVGRGQSALEGAALLREAGALPQLVIRASQLRFLQGDGLGRSSSQLLRRIAYPPLGVGPPGLNRLMGNDLTYRALPTRARGRLATRVTRPAGARWLRPRLRDVPLTTNCSPDRIAKSETALRVTLAGGGERLVDHIIFATGYRIDISAYDFLDPETVARIARLNGAPRLSRHFESSVDGLFFLGAPAASSMGPGLRFVSHTGVAAAALASRASRAAR